MSNYVPKFELKTPHHFVYIAQWLEQRTVNAQVIGSSPIVYAISGISVKWQSNRSTHGLGPCSMGSSPVSPKL